MPQVVPQNSRFLRSARASRFSGQRKSPLKKHVEYVAKQAAWRMSDGKIFLAELKGKPKASVEILYRPNDDEALIFAQQLKSLLGDKEPEGAGWNVGEPQPIPATGISLPEHGRWEWISKGPADSSGRSLQFLGPYKPGLPPEVRFLGTGASGLTLVAKHLMDDSRENPSKPTPLNALTWALINSTGLDIVTQDDLFLSEGMIILVVGQRR